MSFDICCVFVFVFVFKPRPILHTLSCNSLFSLSSISWTSSPIYSILLIAAWHSIIVTVWSFISPNPYWRTFGLCPILLLLRTVQRISLHIYLGALAGELFIGGSLLMCKHDRFRMPHAGCSGDRISVRRRAQLGKRHPAHVSPHYGPDRGPRLSHQPHPKERDSGPSPLASLPHLQILYPSEILSIPSGHL